MEPYALEKGVTLRLATDPLPNQQSVAAPPDPPSSVLRPPSSDVRPPSATTAQLEINVDGRALQQALVNLLDNAIKHSARGETVTVGLERKNQPAPPVIHLWVADHGPGIPAAEQERIFERFYRLGSELRRETQGIGIGLSIVNHIMTAHEGRVLVDSTPGRGSRFTLELPIKKLNEEAEILKS
jgi:two-component system sensor histidine kinase SenX3